MSRSGQSLIELLVAIAIGTILFAGAASFVVPSLTINKSASQVQIAAGLGKEMLDNARVWSAGNWHNVLNLATGSAHSYYLITSSSPFVATSGIESVVISTTTYTRSFSVNDVYRDSNGNVTSTTSGNFYDPSTKQIAITYSWTRGITTTIAMYLTRNQTEVLDQSDWSGGSGLSDPVTAPDAQFATSTNIDYSSVPGSIAALIPTTAYPNGYTYRRTITASSSLVAPSGTALTNFPMLISGTYSYLAASSSGGNVQNPNGYDIIFTSDASGTSPLAYERESYSSSTGASVFWVKVPTLSSSSNVIYMFYDDSAVTTDQSQTNATWNSNYDLVWHLPNGTSLTANDSTANGNNASTNTAAATAGKIDGGASFTAGSSQYISVGDNASLDSGNVTYSVWFEKTSSTQAQYAHVLEKGSGNGAPFGRYYLQLNDSGSDSTEGDATMGMNDNSDVSVNFPSGTFSTNTWYKVDATYANSTGLLTVYLDGLQFGTATAAGTTTLKTDSGPFALSHQPTYGQYFQGNIDETRVASNVETSDWIFTEYNNESNPANFLNLGSATTNSPQVASTGVISSSTDQHWAWNDAIGWIDFYNSGNVGVASSGLTGYASSSIGDISLDCATTRDGNICLSTSSTYPNGYTYRRTITASSSLVAPSGTALTNFPMLISGTYSYLAASSSGGNVQNPNGYDIIFTSDASGTSPLAYERESYSSSTGASVFWVKVPTLSSSSNVIYMFYDDSAVTSDQSNSSGVWGNYLGVYHMDDNAANTTVIDSSGHSNGTSYNDTSGMSAAGVFSRALKLQSANGDYINTNIKSAMDGLSNFSMGAWVNFTSVSNYQSILEQVDDSSGGQGKGTGFALSASYGGSNDTDVQAYVRNTNSSGGDVYTTSHPFSTASWYQVWMTYAGTYVKVYINGQLKSVINDGAPPSVTPTVSPSDLLIGAEDINTYPPSANQTMQEVEVSANTLSSDWIMTAYNNQSNAGSFLTIGSATTNTVSSGYQVLNDGSGDLSGWAWNDAIGWVSFCGGQNSTNCPGATNYETTIDSGGNFQGWAWNDAIGWISFNCDNTSICGTSDFEVKTTWLAPGSATTTIGELDSATFDTGAASGAQFNSILWRGTQVASSTVQFQFAVSNTSSGPWNFVGPDGTSNTYFTPTGSGSAVSLCETTLGSLGCNAFNNFRYFRYRIFITSLTSVSSRVNNVVVNWSP